MIPCRQEAKSNMASVCVQAAMDILRLLPDEPDLHWFYETCPWWCFLHYLMQAVAVCLTAIFISPRSVSDESLCMEAAVSKAMRWLSSISSTNPSSEAALRICTEIIARMRPWLINVSCPILVSSAIQRGNIHHVPCWTISATAIPSLQCSIGLQSSREMFENCIRFCHLHFRFIFVSHILFYHCSISIEHFIRWCHIKDRMMMIKMGNMEYRGQANLSSVSYRIKLKQDEQRPRRSTGVDFNYVHTDLCNA